MAEKEYNLVSLQIHNRESSFDVNKYKKSVIVVKKNYATRNVF